MPPLILLLAFCAQPADDLAPADIVFVAAQEECVIAWLPPPRRLEDGVPVRVARVIRRLGCPTAECRADAREELEWLARRDARWLAWAMRSRDPEIRLGAAAVRDRLFRCRRCFGAGGCRWWIPPDGTADGPCRVCGRHFYSHDPAESRPCLDCRGTGLRP